MAWQSALAGAAASSDPRVVGQALGVRYLVTGQLRRVREGKLRLNVELVGCTDARHLWSTLEEVSDPLIADDEDLLVASLASRLEPQLNLAELNRLEDKAAVPADAWTMLRHAMGALFARGWSEAAVAEAVDSFRRSATADPDLALAHAYKSLLLAIGAKMGLLEGRRCSTRPGAAPSRPSRWSRATRRCWAMRAAHWPISAIRHGPSRCWSVPSRRTPTTPRPGPHSVPAG